MHRRFQHADPREHSMSFCNGGPVVSQLWLSFTFYFVGFCLLGFGGCLGRFGGGVWGGLGRCLEGGFLRVFGEVWGGVWGAFGKVFERLLEVKDLLKTSKNI